jgi:hypothetical protein
MTSTIEKEERLPPHHWREKTTGEVFRWGGLSTCFCTNCHRPFTSVDGFERHFLMDQRDDGDGMECYDPLTLERKDGGPAFEKIEKPTWNPPFVFARARPGEHPYASGDSGWSDADSGGDRPSDA